MKTTRRGFFATLAAAFAIAPAARAIAAKAAATTSNDNATVRIVSFYNTRTGPFTRLDVLYGFGPNRPEYAVRVIADDMAERVKKAYPPRFHKDAFVLNWPRAEITAAIES